MLQHFVIVTALRQEGGIPNRTYQTFNIRNKPVLETLAHWGRDFFSRTAGLENEPPDRPII